MQAIVQLFQAALWAMVMVTVACGQGDNSQWPRHNNGLTTLVEWDHYSYMVNGQRLFVFSGEFHYWRFPVPQLWRDLLEKVRASGFNAFSIYNHWGYHEATQGSLDFETGAHNFTAIMELAKDLGMYMIIRPGPYVNAEANAGGYPLWLTTGAYGSLRTNDTKYTEAWTPYWSKISQIVKPHLITNGGNVIMFQIENELNGQWKSISDKTLNPPVAGYMQALEDTARANGIDVPLSHNAPNMNGYSWSKDFSNMTGNVDVVGVDSYPSCWSCNLSECTGTNGEYVAYQVVDYYTYFTKQSPTQPNSLPEFQGGSYNPWGGPEGGCPADIGVDFANMFYRNLIYQRVTAISLYMLYGGTNWGWLAAPVVASSYDYSSPVSENRVVGDKFYETKLLTLFTRVAKDLAKTDRLGNSTEYSSNPAITAAELRNPDTNAAFYVTMHDASPSGTLETFKLKVNTSKGQFWIPQHAGPITINGHQSKIIVTDFKFGSKTLLYSTAEVLTYSIVDNKEVLVLWLPAGESGEFAVGSVTSAVVTSPDGSTTDCSTNVELYQENSHLTVSYTQGPGMTLVDFADGSRVVLLDRSTAYRFWVPSLSRDPLAPENSTVLVQGPYLVRSAKLNAATKTLELTGDLDGATTPIYVFLPRAACSVSWNGKKLKIGSRNGKLVKATLDGPAPFQLPGLGRWKSHNSLPEIASNYSATSDAWIDATKTSTPNPTKPDSHNLVLYVDDYGIHTGNHVYRATFPSTSEPPTGVFLDITGGLAFGYSVWLNSQFIGSYLGLSYEGAGVLSLTFANATLAPDGSDNTLIILMDNSGHDLREAAVQPRGIANATLLGPSDRAAGGAGYSFTAWKIATTPGADIDKVRGPLNEGGLYAERVGAHLPGFPDDDKWDAVSGDTEAAVLGVDSAGVKVFRTVVPLHVPAGLDVSISFRLTSPSASTFQPTVPGRSNRLRALLFVNGYQYGRFNPYIGNQVHYPVPPGVLNYNGDNTIAVTVWSQSAEGAEVRVEWNVDYVHSSSYDMTFDAAALRPGWTAERSRYA